MTTAIGEDEDDVGIGLGRVCTFDEPSVMNPGIIVTWGYFEDYASCYERLAPQFAYMKEFVWKNRWIREADILRFGELCDKWTAARRREVTWTREMFTGEGRKGAESLWKDLLQFRLKLEGMASKRVILRTLQRKREAALELQETEYTIEGIASDDEPLGPDSNDIGQEQGAGERKSMLGPL